MGEMILDTGVETETQGSQEAPVSNGGRIGQMLMEEGVIDQEVARLAARIQARHPDRHFGEILVHDMGVDHHAVFSRLTRVYGFKEYDFDHNALDEAGVEFVRKFLQRLPDQVRQKALRKKVVPLKVLDKRQEVLLVVTPDPTDREVRGIAADFGYRRPELYYGRPDAVQALLDTVFQSTNEYLEELEEATAGQIVDEPDETDDADLDAEIHRGMLTNLVEGALLEAVRQGASDIHIIPREGNRTELHFRIDGDLQRWYTQEGTRPESVLAVVKDRARGVDRFQRDTAQDGFMQREIDGHVIRFRVSILPISGTRPQRRFESVVIRVMDDRKVITDLDQLGLQPASLTAFKKAITQPQGIVILTGPTGSGKSTTLNAALYHVIDPTKCVLTVEDPVEYIVRGARQVKIGPELRFETAVRSILRHDPDIVMVGEMRDLETAETAIKLANTGHLTFTTLHTNDAPSAVARLYMMGVEPFLIANAINIVIAQRLVRTLCPDCKQPASMEDVDREACLQAGMSEEQISSAHFHKPVGCRACRNGYKGRAGIHEAMLNTKELRHLIVESKDGVDEESIRALALSQGMMTLRQSGLARVANGETTLEEVLSVTMAD